MYDLNYQLEHMKYDLIIQRFRLIYNKPSKSLDSLQIALPLWFNSISNKQQHQQFINHYENIIQRTKTNLMLGRFMILEALLYQYQNNLKQEEKVMYENHHSHVSNKIMTSILLSLIHERSKLIKDKFQIKSNFYINYYLRSPFGIQFESKYLESSMKNSQLRINFTNNLLIHPSITNLSFYLNRQQIKLLNRGPTYIIPCQLQLLNSFQSTDTNILWKQYASFEQQLIHIKETKKYSINSEQFLSVQQKLKDEFQNTFLCSIPSSICQRAQYEQKLLESIQITLKSHHLLLRRTADHNNQFYLIEKKIFEEKCQQFMLKHKEDFEQLTVAHDQDKMAIDLKLKQKISRINSLLENLFKHNHISKALYEKLCIQSDEIQLGYLYFLPEISHEYHQQDCLRVKPIFSMTNSLTWKLSNYLYQLLRPTARSIFEKMKIIQNENEFIERFYHYSSIEHQLRPHTLFVGIKILNYDTMFSYDSIINRVGYALTNSLSNEPIRHISIVTIERLIELFLRSNLFYYEGNLYRFLHGMPSSFHLNELLLNLSLYPWQKKIINHLKLQSEFIIRYRNELFFTWNSSENELHPFLQEIQGTYSDIKMTIDYNRSINFCNIHLENRHGQLYTCLFQQDNKNKSQLMIPYVTGHSIFQHQLWFRSTLCRIIQFSSNYQDFIRQRLYLEMTCLSYGYSIDFIENEFEKFYGYFNCNETVRYGLNQNLYEKLRFRLLNFIKIERQLLDKQDELEDQERLIHFSYFFDYGSSNRFQQKFNKIWSDFVKNHTKLSSDKTKVLLNAKHVFSLNTLLAQDRPNRINKI